MAVIRDMECAPLEPVKELDPRGRGRCQRGATGGLRSAGLEALDLRALLLDDDPKLGDQIARRLGVGRGFHLYSIGRGCDELAQYPRERVHSYPSLYYRPEHPYCEKDLLSEELPRARKMRARLIEWLTEPRPSSLGESARTTSRDEQMLAALSYGGREEAAPSLKLWNPERWAGSDWETDPWRVMFEHE